MTDLIKKGVYLRPEQVDILAKLVYESRKKGKRYISESLIIRAALEMLIASNFDILAYQSEGDIVGAIKGLEKS
ncbi:MAG: hypothetical protein KGZ96_13335 [Clostridia bacterium]|jgi:hypothetical protein|nr:hypothetical protein [Clostridia bacterium]